MLFAVLCVSTGETLLAKGMRLTNGVTGGLLAQARGVLNGYVIVGTLLMAVFFGLYSLSLRWADLSFVLPITALSYLMGAILAKFYLGETISPTRWAGVLIITLGVVVVGLGESSLLDVSSADS